VLVPLFVGFDHGWFGAFFRLILMKLRVFYLFIYFFTLLEINGNSFLISKYFIMSNQTL